MVCTSDAEGTGKKFNASSRRRGVAEIRTIGITLMVMRVPICRKSNVVKPGRSLTYPDIQATKLIDTCCNSYLDLLDSPHNYLLQQIKRP